MDHYTKNQDTLDAMLSCHAAHAGIGELIDFTELGDRVADVMREHCDWRINPSDVQEVSENVWARFNRAQS